MSRRFLWFYGIAATMVAVSAIFSFIALQPEATGRIFSPLQAFASSSSASIATLFVFLFPSALALAQAFAWYRSIHREYWAIERIEEAQVRSGDREVMKGSYKEGFLGALEVGLANRVAPTQTSAMVRAIWEDVYNARFDPLSSIIDRQKPRILTASARLGSYQALAIRLGILGTFVGLVLALGEARDLLSVAQRAGDVEGDASETSVANVVSNLSVAFGTSIGGLVAAMLITLLANIMRAEDFALITKLGDRASGLQGYFRGKKRGDDSLVQTAKELRKHIETNTQQVVATRDALQAEAEKLKAAAEDFRGAAGKPGKLIVDNAAALEALLDSLNEALGRFARVGDQVSALETDALSALTRALSKIEQQQDEKLDRLIKAFREARNEDTAALAEASDAATAKVSATISNFADVIEKGVRDTARAETVQSINAQLNGVEQQFSLLVHTQARWLRGQVLIMTVLGVSVLGLSSFYIFRGRPFAETPSVEAVETEETTETEVVLEPQPGAPPDSAEPAETAAEPEPEPEPEQ